jgi:hypothetical protein
LSVRCLFCILVSDGVGDPADRQALCKLVAEFCWIAFLPQIDVSTILRERRNEDHVELLLLDCLVVHSRESVARGITAQRLGRAVVTAGAQLKEQFELASSPVATAV